jgi:hypothetical protein
MLKENRMAHAIEIIQSCVRNKLKIEEEPVNILYAKYSLDKGQKLYNGLFARPDYYSKILSISKN